MTKIAPLPKPTIVKKRTKKFARHQSDQFIRIRDSSWRKPKGIDSSVRRRFKGTLPMPKIGYGERTRRARARARGRREVARAAAPATPPLRGGATQAQRFGRARAGSSRARTASPWLVRTGGRANHLSLRALTRVALALLRSRALSQARTSALVTCWRTVSTNSSCTT